MKRWKKRRNPSKESEDTILINSTEYKITFKIVIISLLLLLLPVYALAEDLTFSGYAETGARATDESEYELELNDNYVYHNYHAKVAQSFNKKFGYDIGTFLYQKNYEELNYLNNESRIYNAGIFYWLGPQVKLDLDTKYRTKRYESSPDREYNQLLVKSGITWKMEDTSSVGLTLGINRYFYLTKDDEHRRFYSFRGTKVLNDSRLAVSGGFKQELIQEAKENLLSTNTKKILNMGVKYKTLLSWIETISARGEWGRANTKDDDEDVEKDYKYWRWNAGTSHKISEDIDTDIKLEYVSKNYYGGNYDFTVLSVVNTWNISWLRIDLGNKEVNYRARELNNYFRKTLGLSARYTNRMDWNGRAGIEGNFYQYENKIADKRRYYLTAGAEKILAEQMRLGVELKWRITDNRHSADQRDAGIRVTGEIRY